LELITRIMPNWKCLTVIAVISQVQIIRIPYKRQIIFLSTKFGE
jgi:hypothetical protein